MGENDEKEIDNMTTGKRHSIISEIGTKSSSEEGATLAQITTQHKKTARLKALAWHDRRKVDSAFEVNRFRLCYLTSHNKVNKLLAKFAG